MEAKKLKRPSELETLAGNFQQYFTQKWISLNMTRITSRTNQRNSRECTSL